MTRCCLVTGRGRVARRRGPAAETVTPSLSPSLSLSSLSLPLSAPLTVELRRDSARAGVAVPGLGDRRGAAVLRRVAGATAARQAAVDLDGQVLVLRLALLQVGEHRGRDEDRGVGAGQHADEQHERQVLQRARAEQARADEQDRRDRQERGQRGVDRPDQGLVERQVGRVAVGGALGGEQAGGILPDLVEDHHGVVERVAEDGQQADDGSSG